MSTSQILTIIFGSLFAISEVLGAIPAVKSNGVFQLIFNILGELAGKGSSNPPAPPAV